MSIFLLYFIVVVLNLVVVVKCVLVALGVIAFLVLPVIGMSLEINRVNFFDFLEHPWTVKSIKYITRTIGAALVILTLVPSLSQLILMITLWYVSNLDGIDRIPPKSIKLIEQSLDSLLESSDEETQKVKEILTGLQDITKEI